MKREAHSVLRSPDSTGSEVTTLAGRLWVSTTFPPPIHATDTSVWGADPSFPSHGKGRRTLRLPRCRRKRVDHWTHGEDRHAALHFYRCGDRLRRSERRERHVSSRMASVSPLTRHVDYSRVVSLEAVCSSLRIRLPPGRVPTSDAVKRYGVCPSRGAQFK